MAEFSLRSSYIIWFECFRTKEIRGWMMWVNSKQNKLKLLKHTPKSIAHVLQFNDWEEKVNWNTKFKATFKIWYIIMSEESNIMSSNYIIKRNKKKITVLWYSQRGRGQTFFFQWVSNILHCHTQIILGWIKHYASDRFLQFLSRNSL